VILTIPDGDLIEIPDAWLNEAGFTQAILSTPAFKSDTPDNRLEACFTVPIDRIVPLKRRAGFVGLVHERSVYILKRFVSQQPLPRVSVEPSAGGRWVIRDGFHRYHLSMAVGFTHLPIEDVGSLW
jgi:hypothetical protein